MAWWLAISVSTLVVGLVLVWLAGRGAARILEAGRTRVGPAIGLGLLAALLLIYALGYSATAWVLGRSVVRGRTGWAVAFLAGWAILRLLALIPILGALAVAVWRARTTSPAAQPAWA